MLQLSLTEARGRQVERLPRAMLNLTALCKSARSFPVTSRTNRHNGAPLLPDAEHRGLPTNHSSDKTLLTKLKQRVQKLGKISRHKIRNFRPMNVCFKVRRSAFLPLKPGVFVILLSPSTQNWLSTLRGRMHAKSHTAKIIDSKTTRT